MLCVLRFFSKTFSDTSPQVVEYMVVLEVFQKFHCPLNIISDSAYVVNSVNLLETAGIIKPTSTVASLFHKI